MSSHEYLESLKSCDPKICQSKLMIAGSSNLYKITFILLQFEWDYLGCHINSFDKI